MLVADFAIDGHETFFGGNAGNIEYLYRYHGKYAINRHKRKINYVVKNGAVMQSAKKNDQNYYIKNNTRYSF